MGIFEIGGISIFVAFAAGLLSVDSPQPVAAAAAAATAGGGGATTVAVGGNPRDRSARGPSPFLHAVALGAVLALSAASASVWQGVINYASGALLIIVGILIFTNSLINFGFLGDLSAEA